MSLARCRRRTYGRLSSCHCMPVSGGGVLVSGGWRFSAYQAAIEAIGVSVTLV